MKKTLIFSAALILPTVKKAIMHYIDPDELIQVVERARGTYAQERDKKS